MRSPPVILRPPSRFAGLLIRDDVRLLVEACDRLAFPTRRVAEKLAGGEARHERNHRNPPRERIRPRGAGESRASSGAHPLGARNRWLRSSLASPPANLFQPSGLPPDPQPLTHHVIGRNEEPVISAFPHQRGVRCRKRSARPKGTGLPLVPCAATSTSRFVLVHRRDL